MFTAEYWIIGLAALLLLLFTITRLVLTELGTILEQWRRLRGKEDSGGADSPDSQPGQRPGPTDEGFDDEDSSGSVDGDDC